MTLVIIQYIKVIVNYNDVHVVEWITTYKSTRNWTLW